MRAVLISVSNRPEPAVCCRYLACRMGSHSITCHRIQANPSLPNVWEEGQTSPYYCRNLPGGEAGTKLYCFLTETHVCEQIAQGRYLAVPRGSESKLQHQGYKFGTLPLHRQASKYHINVSIDIMLPCFSASEALHMALYKY